MQEAHGNMPPMHKLFTVLVFGAECNFDREAELLHTRRFPRWEGPAFYVGCCTLVLR